jgi:GMP synthase-like glutamine amidotransferase
MVNCLVVQHVAPESAWAIGDALSRAGVTVDVRRAFAGDDIPLSTNGYDGLVVMGGPMSADSDDGFPTRQAELNLISHALDSRVPTLGVCLGAQLVALAGGSHVYVGAQGAEIGWAPVELSYNCRGDFLFGGLPQKLTVLHWHGDTFDLPTGAKLLISNDMYRNQAFRIGDMAWGVQFHLEVTFQAVEAFLREFTDDAASVAGGPDAMRRETPAALAALRSPRDLVFDRFATLIADRGQVRHHVRSRRHFAHIST